LGSRTLRMDRDTSCKILDVKGSRIGMMGPNFWSRKKENSGRFRGDSYEKVLYWASGGSTRKVG